ncbi:MAG: V-type ATP synthase subunit D [Candidatus Heimdallarchaeota archaeon]|nr:V-type ATP synthase subunit D [Candidatus Heimdallarchaeota archaeon]
MSSEDIIPGITPTRMQLLDLNQRLELANKGYELLSEKLEALTGELFSAIDTYKEARKRVEIAVQKSYKELRQLELQMGDFAISKVAMSYPRLFSIESQKRNMMGISVPIFRLTKEISKDSILNYSMSETTARFDTALLTFESALKAIVDLAEIHSSLTRLAKEITDTKRRVNALNYIIIPRIRATVAWIKLTLAEQERESFVRLKKVKKKISANSMSESG